MRGSFRRLATIGALLASIVFLYGATVISTEFGNLANVIKGVLYSATQASLSALSVDDQGIINLLNSIDHAAILEYNSSITNLKLDRNRYLHHAKFLITDSVVIFGSMNFTRSSLYEDLNDGIVFYDREVIEVFEDIFNKLWTGNTPKAMYKTKIGTFYLSPFMDLEDVIYKTLEKTKSEVDIAIYAFTDMNVLGALKYLTSKGVRVRIAMDDWSERYIGKYPLEQFEVKVFKDVTLHHKFVIVDGSILLTGSANLTESAFRKNFEVIFLTRDKEIIHQYKEIFDLLWGE